MKRISGVMMVGVLLLAPPVMATELHAEAKQQVMGFAKALKGALQQGVKQGGIENAIDVCNIQAPQVAAAHSQGDWRVRRTSLKLRNPENQPDAWELSVLQSFEQRLAAGEPASQLVAATQDGGEFRFMKAIPTGKLCLSCHGSNLAPRVSRKLDTLYPQDQARGFKAGDIRGAFSLRKSLE